jgi:CBS domain-containing protein
MTKDVVTVTPDATVKAVARLLVDRAINAVPVVDVDGRLMGIVSERDLLPLETHHDPRRHAMPNGNGSAAAPPPGRTAGELMTRDVVALPPDADVADVARLMIDHRIKQIPIVEGHRVVGIVARRDLLNVLARTDTDIHLELSDLLDDEVRAIGRYRAEVVGGVVTLRGPVDTESRRLARAMAWTVPGVIGVRFADTGA